MEQLKIFWNGIKVDGGKLIKCTFDFENIHSWEWEAHASYGTPIRITHDYYRYELYETFIKTFSGTDSEGNTAINETKYFFDLIAPDCPLYDYFFAAAVKARTRFYESFVTRHKAEPEYIAESEKEIERLKSITPAVKTAVPLVQIEAFEKWKTQKADDERAEYIAEMETEEERRRQKFLREEGYKKILEELEEKYPIEKEKYSVVFNWSESPSIGEGKHVSLTAAEAYIKFLSGKKDCGYYKTDFTIIDNTDNGKYNGRRDIGDGEGLVGLIDHVKNYVDYCESGRGAPYWQMDAEKVTALREFIADMKASVRA